MGQAIVDKSAADPAAASLVAAENLTKEPPSHKSTLLFLGQIHFQMMLKASSLLPIFFVIHLPI